MGFFEGNESSGIGSVPKSGNVVYVNEEKDFGTVTAGVKIDTIPDTTFVLNSPVVQTLPFVVPTGSCFQLLTTNRVLNTLTYTNAVDAQFQGINSCVIIFDVVLNGNTTGTLFDLTGGYISLKFPDFNRYDNIGTLDSLESIYCPGVLFDVIAGGVNLIDCVSSTFTGCFIISLDGNTFSFFNISGASSGDIQISTAICDNDEFSSFVYVDPATYPNDHTVSITACNITIADNFFGAGSIIETDIRMILAANKGNQDSVVSAGAFLVSNALVTDIPAVNSFVIINGTTWTGDAESRILVNSDGVSDYLDLRKTSLTLDGDASMEPTLATKDLTTRFAQIDPERFTVTFTNATNLINEAGTALSNNDTIMFKDTVGTLPTGLRADVMYFVINKLTNSFQVSYTLGGAAVAFTTDGTPVNSYGLTSFHGSSPQNVIAANAARSLTPQALKCACPGSKIFLMVSNKTDDVNILVNEAYYRILG